MYLMRTSEVGRYLQASGIKQTILEREIKLKAPIILRVHVNLIMYKKLGKFVFIFPELKPSGRLVV